MNQDIGWQTNAQPIAPQFDINLYELEPPVVEIHFAFEPQVDTRQWAATENRKIVASAVHQDFVDAMKAHAASQQPAQQEIELLAIENWEREFARRSTERRPRIIWVLTGIEFVAY